MGYRIVIQPMELPMTDFKTLTLETQNRIATLTAET